MRRMLRGLLLLAVLLCLAPSARADVSQDVYSDAKDIITELIERDVAESVASDLACYSPDGLLKYFPNTLQAVFDRNMGAIKTQLERDTVNFVANYAFDCFRQKRSIPLGQFLPVSGFDPNDATTNKCREEVRDAGGPAEYAARVEAAHVKREVAYRPIDLCESTQPKSREVEALCPFVAALRGATAENPKEGLLAFAEAAASIGFKAWSADLSEGLRLAQPGVALQAQVQVDSERVHAVVFEELLSRLTTGHYDAAGLLAKVNAQDFTKAIELLDTIKALKASATKTEIKDEKFKLIFDAPSPRTRLYAGALRLLLASEAPLRINVDHASVKNLLPTLKLLVVGMSPPKPGDLPGETLARSLLAHAGAAPFGSYVVSETDDGVDLTGGNKTRPLALTGPGLARLAEIEAMFKTALNLEQLLDAVGLEPSSRQYLIVKVLLQTIVGLVQSVEETAEALKAIPRKADGRIDLLTLLDAFVRPNKNQGFCPPLPAGAATPAPGGPVMHVTLCALMRQAVAIADPQNLLLPILGSALDHDYRRVAVQVTNSVFSAPAIEAMCCGKQASCRDIAVLYGRLAKTVVSYVLMPRNDEDQSIAARAAFKSAAIDVIREIGKRGGVDRKTASIHSLLIPTGTLRAAWSGSYQQVDVRGNGIRYSPTIDWPTLRWRVTPNGSAAYLGLALSALDGLAPFTEAVSRKRELAYHNEYNTAWLTAVVPRVSGLLALPWLTKNTALVVSAGMRLAAPYEVGKTDDGRRLFTYSTVFGNADTRNNHMNTSQLMWQAVELSAGVQYVP
ncbi:MAG: hypothetical protein ABUL60_15660 [Myxococcales bacterium]